MNKRLQNTLKQYRRLWNREEDRFKPRMSYSAYRYFINNDWDNFFAYLTGQETFSTSKMEQGREAHEWLEFFGIPQDLKEQVESMKRSVILDYKFGKLDGYQQQLENYAWLLINATKSESGKSEVKITVDKGEYEITGVIDYLHVKQGQEFIGMLAKIYPEYEEGEIKKVHVVSTRTYELDIDRINKWEAIYYEAYNTLNQFIKDGYFIEWLELNG